LTKELDLSSNLPPDGIIPGFLVSGMAGKSRSSNSFSPNHGLRERKAKILAISIAFAVIVWYD
jgi:hypothetical protein